MEKILLPVDGSPQSDHAVDEMIRLIQEEGFPAELHLLYVPSPSPLGNNWPVVRHDPRDNDYYCLGEIHELSSARNKLNEAAVPHAHHVALGRPAQAIVDFCQQIQCHRIVIGRRASSRLIPFPPDTVSAEVSRIAKVPVSIIPENLACFQTPLCGIGWAPSAAHETTRSHRSAAHAELHSPLIA